jgi:hypothetical protein
MNRTLRIATIGMPDDYQQSLVPQTFKALGYTIEWTQQQQADLLVYGPFQKPQKQRDRFIPKPLRPLVRNMFPDQPQHRRAVTLFQTGENLRHDHLEADFTISFDLAVTNDRHCRLPYWMEQVDWTHEGVHGTSNPRFGELLKIHRLMQPLGRSFLDRPMRAAFFSSHLREPRKTLFVALQKLVEVDGFGSQFDPSIAHHSSSAIQKKDILLGYALNLCPENSMYPGYYTEKIPEAFHAGCLPISWTDSNVCADFNPEAFINLAPMTHDHFAELANTLHSPSTLARYAGQALLKQAPTLHELKDFLREVAAAIKS